jgi:hypothetical protein
MRLMAGPLEPVEWQHHLGGHRKGIHEVTRRQIMINDKISYSKKGYPALELEHAGWHHGAALVGLCRAGMKCGHNNQMNET